MVKQDYIVLVYPPAPALRGEQKVYSNATIDRGPRVVTIRDAISPEAAAQKADVQPGGHCIVVVQARRFDRAEKAPLEEHDLSGIPFPTVERGAA